MPANNGLPQSKPLQRRFPLRQSILAAGLCATLVLTVGWLEAPQLGVLPATRPWWLLFMGLASAVVGFATVTCEWLLSRFFRRLGVPSCVDMRIRSDF